MCRLRPSFIMAACYFYTSFVALAAVFATTGHSGNNRCAVGCSCLGSMVDCSKIGLNSVPQDIPPWVVILELSSNKLSTINGSAFRGLHLLEELHISSNQLVSVNSDLLLYLPRLKLIKLSANRLTSVPELASAANLTSLILQHNQISRLDRRALQRLSSLRVLDLSNNRVRELTNTTFPQCPTMRQLLLTSNRIVGVAAGAFSSLTGLETLKLSRNRLQRLPKAVFSSLKHLKLLELSRNRLRTLEGLTFQGLDNLATLRLRRNGITHMMDGVFWGLSSIQLLQLDHNNISAVSKSWVYGLNSLQTLSLAHNRIQNIDGDSWQYCESLRQLDLSYNALKTVSMEMFDRLHSLHDLYLNNNQLSHIASEAFSSLSSLLILELGHNGIAWNIENGEGTFSGLEGLSQLGLSANGIRSITRHAFAGLGRLDTLRLEGNAVGAVEDNAFEALTALRLLRLNTSTLVCDCRLAWLPRWLVGADLQTTLTARCVHPAPLKGRSIFDVSPADFKCSDVPMPLLIREPVSAIALRGGNISLECTATSSVDTPMSVVWKKDNMVLHDVRIDNWERVMPAGNETPGGNETGGAGAGAGAGDGGGAGGRTVNFTSRLHMSGATDADSGSYQCVITNSFGSSYSRPAQIDVHVFPTFTKTPMDITVRSGATARLDCAAAGEPAPQVAWRKDGGGDDFPAARERRMHVMPADDAFFIVKVTRADAGVYSCTATNAAGTVMAHATVTVLETPAFARPMAVRRVVQRGDSAVLECLASGSPRPRIQWLKDGRPLVVTPRHFVTADGQLLVIVETRRTDAGRYTCQLSNTLGRERGDTLLVVRDAGAGGGGGDMGDGSMTTGIIVIAVVCCVVGTSLIWVVIIYQTRKRPEELNSSTPTDETTVAADGRDDDDDELSTAFYRRQHRLQLNKYPDSLDRTISRLRGDSMYTDDLDDADDALEPLTYEARCRLRDGSSVYKPLLYSLSSSAGVSTSDADTDGCASTQSTCSSGSRQLPPHPPPHPAPDAHGDYTPLDVCNGGAQHYAARDTYSTTFTPPREASTHEAAPCLPLDTGGRPPPSQLLERPDSSGVRLSPSLLLRASPPPPPPSVRRPAPAESPRCGRVGRASPPPVSPRHPALAQPMRTHT